MRTDILEKKKEILIWINKKYSKSEICRELKCKHITLNSYLDKMNIKYKGNQGGKNRKSGIGYMKAENYLYNGSPIQSYKLKNKLIEDGIKEHKCEECEKNEWLGKLIPIELHHLDGNHYNNELINLQLLCPNCHSFTENYRGKGIKNKTEKGIKNKCECGNDKTKRSKVCIKCYHSGKYGRKKVKNIKKCECGEIINRKSNQCSMCYSKSQRRVKNRPSQKQLKENINELGYEATGRKYGVSGNSIRKWVKK